MKTELRYSPKERMALQSGNPEIQGITLDSTFLFVDHTVRVVDPKPVEKSGKRRSDMECKADRSPALYESGNSLDFLWRVRSKRP